MNLDRTILEEALENLGAALAERGLDTLIFLKFYAAVDSGPRSRHVQDLRALDPTRDELLAAAAWVRTQDPSEEFRTMVLGVLTFFGVEAADAFV